jgi:hypothetical protein
LYIIKYSQPELHDQFIHILENFSLRSDSLAPLIKQQTLATYYKLTEEGEDDVSIYENRLKEIDHNIERQKNEAQKRKYTLRPVPGIFT